MEKVSILACRHGAESRERAEGFLADMGVAQYIIWRASENAKSEIFPRDIELVSVGFVGPWLYVGLSCGSRADRMAATHVGRRKGGLGNEQHQRASEL